MLFIQTLLTGLILLFFFLKFRIGLCVYIAYIFIVPYCNLNIGGVSFSWNLINTALLLAYCIDCKRRCGKIRFVYKPFIPFFLLYGLLLLEMPFQSGVPIDSAFNMWRLDIFNMILPIIMLSASQYDKNIGKDGLITMIFVCVVVIVYAFLLIPLQGVNPYIMELARINNVDIMDAQFGEQSTRLMIKISSVFTHPMTLGAFLGMAAVYVFSQLYYSNNKRIVLLSVLVGLFSCIFICGIRTPIASLFITVAVYLLLKRNFKVFIYASLIGIVCYYIIIQIPALTGTISSIIDSDSSNVGGSSIDMRLSQLDAAFDEVRDCMIFGKGYGYNSYYWSMYGTHPRLYSFESLVLVILCNYGMVGFLIWGIMFYKVFKISKKMNLKSSNIYIAILIVYYISFTCITGEYSYMKYLLIFYSLIIINAYLQRHNRLTITYNKNGI